MGVHNACDLVLCLECDVTYWTNLVDREQVMWVIRSLNEFNVDKINGETSWRVTWM